MGADKRAAANRLRAEQKAWIAKGAKAYNDLDKETKDYIKALSAKKAALQAAKKNTKKAK
jgi:hypothetical protein